MVVSDCFHASYFDGVGNCKIVDALCHGEAEVGDPGGAERTEAWILPCTSKVTQQICDNVHDASHNSA